VKMFLISPSGNILHLYLPSPRTEFNTFCFHEIHDL
jgi:hypothetical protein